MAPKRAHRDEGRVVAALELASAPGGWLALPATTREEARVRARDWRGWRIGGNVVGMGVAAKTVRGSETSVLALKIYVVEKRPLRALPAGSRVPPLLRLPHIPGDIVTDVEEIGRMRLEGLTARVRPVVPGYSIAHRESTAGTAGALVRDARPGGSGDIYILSNSHVLALSGIAHRGDAILQPGPEDGGGRQDRIAPLDRWQAFDFGPDFVNLVDAALAGPLEPGAATAEIASIGVPAGIAKEPHRGMKVQKTGRTTAHTVGEVKDVHYRTALTYPRPGKGGGNGRVLFRDQVLSSRFTEAGDSGSLVLDEARLAVGLHFSGSPTVSVANPIAAVLQALEVELVTEALSTGARAGETERVHAVDASVLRAALERHAPRIMRSPGVVGAGIAEKISGGQHTGQDAVVFYVSRKKSRRTIPAKEMIPPSLEVPRPGGGRPLQVPTDVVEVGPMELE